jgi:branched-subunit amino acid ABC-type transport system permease component
MSTVLVNGFFVGVVYGLLAVGLVVIYRGSRVINFAYGETGMIAAFVYADLRFGSSAAGLGTSDAGLWLTVPAALLIGAAIGAATEVFVARPLRHAPPIRALVGTFAVAALLLTFAARRWGLSPRFTKPLVEGGGVRLAGLQVQPAQILIFIVGGLTVIGLWALYRFTSFGLRLRATALDSYAAGLVGVNVNRTSMATWALGGALSAASAILIAPLVAFNVVFMTLLSIRALAAALVGGLTSVGGAFVAGLLIGLAEAVIAFESPVTGITDAAVAVFVLVLVLIRPAGLVRSAY